eukprot:Hpha_TRINITY_DN16775_c0_g1::TRINITY_DN16775_c0_g1_i1::g.76631::m.76631
MYPYTSFVVPLPPAQPLPAAAHLMYPMPRVVPSAGISALPGTVMTGATNGIPAQCFVTPTFATGVQGGGVWLAAPRPAIPVTAALPPPAAVTAALPPPAAVPVAAEAADEQTPQQQDQRGETPPPLVDTDESFLVKAGMRQEARVVLLSAVPVDTDLKALMGEVSSHFKVDVVRSLAVWNKSALLVELSRPVVFEGYFHDIGPRGIRASPSTKPGVQVAGPSHTLNVRIFVMHPEQDFDGSAEQKAVYAAETQDWANSKTESFAPLKALIKKASGEDSEALIAPRQARMMSGSVAEQCQRCYTQLLFKYSTVASARQALNRMEGFQDSLGALRMVVRAEFARPHPNGGAVRRWQSHDTSFRNNRRSTQAPRAHWS